jgi:hypothetical protein
MRDHRLRQGVAALPFVVGMGLLRLAPSAGPARVAFGLGGLIEAVGLALERRDPRAR